MASHSEQGFLGTLSLTSWPNNPRPCYTGYPFMHLTYSLLHYSYSVLIVHVYSLLFKAYLVTYLSSNLVNTYSQRFIPISLSPVSIFLVATKTLDLLFNTHTSCQHTCFAWLSVTSFYLGYPLATTRMLTTGKSGYPFPTTRLLRCIYTFWPICDWYTSPIPNKPTWPIQTTCWLLFRCCDLFPMVGSAAKLSKEPLPYYEVPLLRFHHSITAYVRLIQSLNSTFLWFIPHQCDRMREW